MYADLHTHLMPGVDDGSPDMETSLEWISDLAAGGLTDLAITPHVNWFFDPAAPSELQEKVALRGWGQGGKDPLLFVPQGFAALQAAVNEASIPVRLHQGAELNPEVAALQSAEMLESIALGPKGKQWILMEVSIFHDFDEAWTAAADHLRQHGYDVLLAHPERARNIGDLAARRLLLDEMKKGVRLQVNLSSLTNPRLQPFATELLADGHAYCVASDIHPCQRPDFLSSLPEVLSDLGFDEAQASLLASLRPASLLYEGF